ncbi:hypothetical protein B0H17DRAFT_2517 [Mycena rosella]|uniref:Uncharacterized protein n=1 Tax=Mycena rosella TaxID=1033263 RepID=A0AAD7MCJ1_MYCRO|nr:hypothetical protein B0H17DRAFT_2517 [Mycena rosella]
MHAKHRKRIESDVHVDFHPFLYIQDRIWCVSSFPFIFCYNLQPGSACVYQATRCDVYRMLPAQDPRVHGRIVRARLAVCTRSRTPICIRSRTRSRIPTCPCLRSLPPCVALQTCAYISRSGACPSASASLTFEPPSSPARPRHASRLRRHVRICCALRSADAFRVRPSHCARAPAFRTATCNTSRLPPPSPSPPDWEIHGSTG